MGSAGDYNFDDFVPEDWDSLLDDRDYNYVLHSNINWESQLNAIRAMLTRNSKARDEFSEYIRKNEDELKAYSGPHREDYVEQHYDLYHDTVYQDAAESMAAIGMIAPMIESTLSQAMTALGEMYARKEMEPPEHDRWHLSVRRKERWDCQCFFKANGDRSKNILEGFPQLAAASGLHPYLPTEFHKWFRAMFTYRNSMFHGGFEWTVKRRQDFGKQIQESGWQEYFTCSRSDHKPWIYYLSSGTIEAMPDMVGKMLDGIGRFAKALPFDLISETP